MIGLFGAFARLLVVALVASAALAGVAAPPATAEVAAVGGGAFGYYVNVGLFGGPQTLRGHGQAADAPATAASPSVTLPPEGSGTAISAADPDGAKAQYGPAVIFGGIWPDNVASAPPSGPMSVSTQGTPGGGSVTSSASIVKHPVPVPVGCASGFAPPCTAPGGIGPGPLVAEEAHSTCTATESGVTGSATFVNGILETKYDSVSQLPIVTEPIPVNPPPNYTRSGTIDHVGDRFTIVFNEQIVGPDSITVNAAHMYLLGEIARGDMVVGSSTCSLSSTTPNLAPIAADDSYSTAEDTPLTLSASGLLGNDIDPNADPLTAARAQAVFVPGPSHPTFSTGNTYTFPSDPPNGTATINSDGSFTYTPDPDFAGTDTFTYVASDPRGANDSGTVTVTVTPVPDDPIAGDDTYDVNEDTPITVPAPGVLANDRDGDGDTLTAGSAGDPANGTVSLASDGSFTYSPDSTFIGTDTFTYVVSDGTGATDTGAVTVVVTPYEAVLLKDLSAGAGSSSPSRFAQLGDAAYFLTSDGLWRTDGTAAGTTLVKGFQFPASTAPALTPMGGSLFFQANDGSSGAELWRTDGTAAGTVLVKDVNPGSASSSPANFRLVDGSLFFAASNGTTTGTNGTELWKSDGTEAGTAMVKDINPGTASSSPANLTAVGSTVFFSAGNGTTTGAHGTELWRSDGTDAGTVMVKDINPGTASATPNNITVFAGTLLFAANDGTNGIELWRSDGTEGGTALVEDINFSFAASSSPANLTVAGGMVLFAANGGSGSELWRTDGTEAGTQLVKEINPGSAASSPGSFAVTGGLVYFSANNGSKGSEPWRTDGTEAGTTLLEDINPGSAGSAPASLTPALGTVLFAANDGTTGIEPWRLAPPKQGPVAVDDAYSIGEDTALAVPAPGVLGNDTDGNGDTLSARSASDPPNGTVALSTDGSFLYTPDAGFVGTDTFTYVADDGDAGTDAGLVTISVEAAAPVVSVGDVSVAEGDGGTRTAVFSLSLSEPSASTVTVAYATADGTASAPGDYTAKSGTVSIAPGVAKASVKVAIAGDGTDESDESFTVELSVPTGATLGDGTGGGTIVDDDPRTITGRRLAIGDVAVHEGDAGPRTAVFTVSLSKASTSYVKVSFATANGTATKALDYTRTLGTLTFAPGATSMTVAVPIAPDDLAEGDEAFTVNLSAASGATITDASGIGTILDDDD